MTFERWNTLARTSFLLVLAGLLAALMFQARGMLKDAREDESSLAVQASDLLSSARDFIPAKPLDMDQVNGVVSSVQGVVNDAHATMNLINRPCPPEDGTTHVACGTLADFNRTLATARGTMGQVESAAIHENKNLGTLDKQEADAAKGLNDDLEAFRKVLTSKDLFETMHNLDKGSAAVADSAVQTDLTLKDVHDEVHGYVHPTKKKGFWAGVDTVGDHVSHWWKLSIW